METKDTPTPDAIGTAAAPVVDAPAAPAPDMEAPTQPITAPDQPDAADEVDEIDEEGEIDEENHSNDPDAVPAVTTAAVPTPPPTGSSEPGYVPPERPIPEDPRAHAQQHIDRMHALLDVVKQDLATAKHWAVDEIRTILHELGATKSE